MLWVRVQWALPLLVLNCLVQCAEPKSARKNEILPTTKEPTKLSKLKITPELKLPSTRLKQTAKPTAKPTTKKETAKKTTASAPLNEFSLNEILFKGRQSNEANAFLKANEQRGKTLETTYEHIREQDLNDIEALVRRRNVMRLTRS